MAPVAWLAALALFGSGCADTLSSMTQHFFYGYVVSVDDSELCLTDARVEDESARRCFAADGQDYTDLEAGTLVKVQYERAEDGHGGGTAVSVKIVD